MHTTRYSGDLIFLLKDGKDDFMNITEIENEISKKGHGFFHKSDLNRLLDTIKEQTKLKVYHIQLDQSDNRINLEITGLLGNVIIENTLSNNEELSSSMMPLSEVTFVKLYEDNSSIRLRVWSNNKVYYWESKTVTKNLKTYYNDILEKLAKRGL